MRLPGVSVIAVWCLVVMLGACNNLPTSPTAKTDYNHSYDFSNVHKIAIQPIPRDTIATMLMSDTLIKNVDEALTLELLRRGFKVVEENADADIYLSWQFVPQKSATEATFDPTTQKISEAMFYVNMVDPMTLQSVWRATFQANLRDKPETATAASYRQQAAKVILAQFPPEPEAS